MSRIVGALAIGLAIGTLSGCFAMQEEPEPEVITKTAQSSDFVLTITAPSATEVGDVLQARGTLEYIGQEPLVLSHGEPIIRFHFSGSGEERGYTDIGYTTEFRPGQVVTAEDAFAVTKKGTHELFVSVEGPMLVMEPIEVVVK
ncbi:hypothetical protein MO973_26490 [Paenibacillus sp. TRM 82003]|nr:hypothetical protein [Paenibacillus sp. TRM 82003]